MNQNVYYEFNVMDRIVDPVIYGTIDVLGCIPGVDFFADGAGMLYATARGDGQEMVVYTAALATPFIGAAIYHSGQKMVSYYAKQTAEGVFEIQAKLLEENLQGWVKISDDIPITNQNVSSKLDELNSPAALNAFDEETVEVLVKVKQTGFQWIDDIADQLPLGAKKQILDWGEEGLDIQKLKIYFENSVDKVNSYNSLIESISYYHRLTIIKDFERIPGITFSELGNGNSYPNGYILENTTVKLLDGSNDPNFSISFSADVMSFANGSAELIFLEEGTKLYRVCGDGMNQFTGGYWVRTKPNSLTDVIGGTAVQPEWNNFKNIVEYTVPSGGVYVWKGNSAAQKLSNNLNIANPHLAGGSEQIFIPLIYRRLKYPDGTFNFGAINPNFSTNIHPLNTNEIPWLH